MIRSRLTDTLTTIASSVWRTMAIRLADSVARLYSSTTQPTRP